MARVLGLDLGSYSVKAVLLEPVSRGMRQLTYAEVRRAPEEDRNETLRAALRELLDSLPETSEHGIVVGMTGTSLALHSLTLPFPDPKRIEAALPFELESQLPFDLADAAFDYQSAGRRDTKTQVLAGVIRQEDLSALLATLAESDVDPRVVTHPALAYQNLFQYAPQLFGELDPEEIVAVVDIGHERTCVAMGRPGGSVDGARTFAGGGKDLSRLLAVELGMSVPEASHWKETRGALGASASGPEGARAAAAFQRGLAGLLRELRATLKSYNSSTRNEVSRLYLCGGTARLPGLVEHVAQELQLRTQLLALPQEAEASIPGRQQASAAQAYTLALRGLASGARAPRFNFRRGPFAFRGDTGSLRARVAVLSAFAATLLLLFIASLGVRSSLLSRREKDVDRQLCAITERELGRCEPNYDRALNLLRGKDSPAGSVPKSSAVALLAELTQHVPPDVTVKFDQMVIDLERIQLRGEAESPRQVDSLSRALKTSPCFQEVKEGKVEKTRDGQRFAFRLDVQVQCEGKPKEGEP